MTNSEQLLSAIEMIRDENNFLPGVGQQYADADGKVLGMRNPKATKFSLSAVMFDFIDNPCFQKLCKDIHKELPGDAARSAIAVLNETPKSHTERIAVLDKILDAWLVEDVSEPEIWKPFQSSSSSTNSLASVTKVHRLKDRFTSKLGIVSYPRYQAIAKILNMHDETEVMKIYKKFPVTIPDNYQLIARDTPLNAEHYICPEDGTVKVCVDCKDPKFSGKKLLIVQENSLDIDEIEDSIITYWDGYPEQWKLSKDDLGILKSSGYILPVCIPPGLIVLDVTTPEEGDLVLDLSGNSVRNFSKSSGDKEDDIWLILDIEDEDTTNEEFGMEEVKEFPVLEFARRGQAQPSKADAEYIKTWYNITPVKVPKKYTYVTVGKVMLGDYYVDFNGTIHQYDEQKQKIKGGDRIILAKQTKDEILKDFKVEFDSPQPWQPIPPDDLEKLSKIYAESTRILEVPYGYEYVGIAEPLLEDRFIDLDGKLYRIAEESPKFPERMIVKKKA